MGTGRAAKILPGLGAVLGSVWYGITQITTAFTLPEDASKLWAALVNAPEYLPVAVVAVNAAVLVYVLWRERKAGPEPLRATTPSRFESMSRLRQTMPHLPMFGVYETPFRDLVRRVALDSEWGLSYEPKPWPTWQDDLKREVLRGLATRNVRAQGVRHEPPEPADSAPSLIPPDFWTKAAFIPEHMLVSQDASMAFQQGEPCPRLYTEVMLDDTDIDRVWPAVSPRKKRGRVSAFSALARRWFEDQECARLSHNVAQATDQEAFGEAFDERVSGWMPFVRLRDFAPAWGVPLPRIGVGQNNAYHLEGALRQAAVRGHLKVEGRRFRGPVRHNDPLVPIPPEHFHDYGFGHGVLNYDEPNEASHTGDVRMMTNSQRGKEDVTYYDLHLSERDARAVVLDFAKDTRVERP